MNRVIPERAAAAKRPWLAASVATIAAAAKRSWLAASGATIIIAVVGCGDDPGPADGNPLGTGDNLLPYPSSLYERSDADSPTGIRLDVPSGALPVPDSGAVFDPARIDLRSGWPAALTILWT